MDIDAQIEWMLERAVAATEHPSGPPRLSSAIRHAVFPGGARVRPRLCIAVAAACAPEDDLTDALAAAAAIELVHCASLVHDDLPCFDDADERRGKPSVHAIFGETLGVLTGDAMISMSFQTLAREAKDNLRELILVLSESMSPPHGIAAGQAWESERHIDIDAYHNAKTAALFVAATRAGAAAVCRDDAAWVKLGAQLGEAYQVADDLRDALLPASALGKPACQDLRHGRPNAVEVLGERGALKRLEDTIQSAADAVPDCHGAGALRQLVYAQAKRLAPDTLAQRVA